MECDILAPDQLAEFHRYYAANRPVIVRGLAQADPRLIFSWSAEYFRAVLQDAIVPVIESTSGFLSFERNMRNMPYREFVARSFGPQRDEGRYYYFMNSTRLLPEGHDDSSALTILGEYVSRSQLRNLWISRAGVTVGLHFDHAENLNFQLRGDKIFDLYPPGVREYYPMPMFSQTAHISRVFRAGLNPDLRSFPLFDPLRVVRARLREGDALYLPAYWWHQVQSLGAENVNLNCWWLPSVAKQLRHGNQALRGYYQLLSRFVKQGGLLKAPTQEAA